MSDREFFKELPFIEEDDEAITYIIQEMAEKVEPPKGKRLDGLDLTGHEVSLRRLLRDAGWAYREVQSDWLRRNKPMGYEDWQPDRCLKKNWDPNEPEMPYDYGYEVGAGFDDRSPAEWRRATEDERKKWCKKSWDEWWRECWGKGRGNPGGFRDESELAKPPLVAIYHVVNRWWRTVLKTSFRPNFDGLESADTDSARMAHLNPAARLFLLVASEINRRYTGDRCRKVDEENSRDQHTKSE